MSDAGADARQKAHVRDVFTRTADGYVALKEAADRASHDTLLEAAALGPGERVMDLGAGPGFVTCLAAREGRMAIAVDLTQAFLAKARVRARAEGLGGVSCVVADVDHLPITAASVDVALSHKALHHFAHPAAALAEAHRVLRRGGRIAIADTYADEDPGRAARHNHIERVRDPSHVEMVSLPRLRDILGAAGFAGLREVLYEDERPVEWWLSVSASPPDVRAEIEGLLRQSMDAGDSTGLAVREDAAGALWFRRREVVAIGVRP